MISGMGSSDKAIICTLLKREDYDSTKLDSAFSEWKIFIGPTDWEDYSLRKEGAEKYRTHNLPNCTSCPGLYEFGIAISPVQSGREVGKLNKSHIIPVYLGQTDNVRARLQRYGREGAHLENGRMFTDIFSRGLPIVYRWAPMKNKRDAEKKEAQLLDTFDYAWNKNSNGIRRPNDIHKRLDIKPCEPLSLENGYSFYTNQDESNDILSRIFKFDRSRPRFLIPSRIDVNEDCPSVCGVALGKDSVCIRAPVEGRKRCAEHKGMKINCSTSKLIREDKKEQYAKRTILDRGTICGVYLENGSFCTREPVVGRVRCEEHKGMRVHNQKSKLISADMPSISTGYAGSGIIICGKQEYDNTLTGSVSCGNVFNNDSVSICGAITLKGSFCSRRPGEGSNRCWQHGGSGARICSKQEYNNTSNGSISCGNVFKNDYFSTCGAIAHKGSFCSRRPGEGSNRCWQHGGSGARICSKQEYNNTSNGSISYGNVFKNDYFSTCGAITRKGSFCSRRPGNGSNRCWQHGG